MSIMSCLSVVFLPLRRRILSMSSCAVYASTSVVVLRRSPAFSCHILVWRWPRRGTSLANSPVRAILSLLLAPVLWLSVWSVCIFEYLFVWVFPNLPSIRYIKVSFSKLSNTSAGPYFSFCSPCNQHWAGLFSALAPIVVAFQCFISRVSFRFKLRCLRLCIATSLVLSIYAWCLLCVWVLTRCSGRIEYAITFIKFEVMSLSRQLLHSGWDFSPWV